jgi:spermidine dehydrogenase
MRKFPEISRRDFMNGVAMSLAAGTTLSPLELMAMSRAGTKQYYPPALTGMRGSHPGSFEIAHAISLNGVTYPRPAAQTESTYDLVVIGGGVSGLSAAKFYRDRVSNDAKILILDNHDDFGGHASRNEFNIGGKMLLGYGGSQTIDQPGKWSRVAQELLKELSIDVQRFYEYFDQDYYKRRNLGAAMYFDKKTYAVDRLLPDPSGGFFDEPPEEAFSEANIRRMPVSESAQDALLTLLEGGVDYLEGRSEEEKVELLRSISYVGFLQTYAGVPAELTDILRDAILPLQGVGWDAASALLAARYQALGTRDLGLEEKPFFGEDEPYIYHFPDGNGGVARSLVRNLIPDAIPGSTMEDLVMARADYSLLDRASSSIRIRLNSTAVDVSHTQNSTEVDVTYVNAGEVYRVRGKHTILACYNHVVPHICSEVPEEQVAAIRSATKVPLVVANIALRNWCPFSKLGFNTFYSPGNVLFKYASLDFPVSIGDYRFSASPDEPIVFAGWHIPSAPGMGLSARDQYVVGRRRLYEMSFDEFETSIYTHMDGMLGHGGFDAERDIAAITINRWPHGYAYEYLDLYDPPDWGPDKGPHIAGRAQIGRISIANSDASAYAYLNGAIDAADRAVNEQMKV